MRRVNVPQPAGDGWVQSDLASSGGYTPQPANGNSREENTVTSPSAPRAGLHAAQTVVDGKYSMAANASYANLQQLELEGDLIKKLQHEAAPPSRSRVSSDGGQGQGLTIRSSALGAHGVTDLIPEEADAPVPTLFDVALPLVRQGYVAAVDDSFTRCFKSKKRVHWNWNLYLMPAWIAGLVFRYLFLFPLRVLCLALGFLIVGTLFPLVKIAGKTCLPRARTQAWEVFLIQLLATAFVASWSGVIRIHGIRPKPRPGARAGVFVANHSSMIDFIILLQSHPYAVVGQKHGGWVGFLQDNLLSSLHCVWFDRGESKDKKAAAQRLKKHVEDPANAAFPILVFPEGTCVNNEYVVQFKKFVFELGVPVHPIAIKYSKVFVDAYWNSREQSFAQHLARLMTSWAVVADIWFLDPQRVREGESGAEFATRVQHMIAHRAGLKAVPWDGYMKYWRPGERFIQSRQRAVAEEICKTEGLAMTPVTPVPAAPPAVTGEGAPAATGASGSAAVGETADLRPAQGEAAGTGAAGAGVGVVNRQGAESPDTSGNRPGSASAQATPQKGGRPAAASYRPGAKPTPVLHGSSGLGEEGQGQVEGATLAGQGWVRGGGGGPVEVVELAGDADMRRKGSAITENSAGEMEGGSSSSSEGEREREERAGVGVGARRAVHVPPVRP